MTSGNTVAADQLYDIYTMIHVPWWQTSWAHVTAACVFILLAGAVAWLIYKKRKARTRILTPWETALLDLQLLKEMRELHADDLFYLKLTTILKRYLDARYELHLQGKTDAEIVVHMENAAIKPEIIALAGEFLQETVMIKFAQVPAQAEEKEKSIDALTMIIKQTIPVPEETK